MFKSLNKGNKSTDFAIPDYFENDAKYCSRLAPAGRSNFFLNLLFLVCTDRCSTNVYVAISLEVKLRNIMAERISSEFDRLGCFCNNRCYIFFRT